MAGKMRLSRRTQMRRMSFAGGTLRAGVLLSALLSAGSWGSAHAPAGVQQSTAKPYPVEYYYQVKWGHFDEFMELYRRNHYPILLREQKLGRILSMNATYPVYHAGEAKRWDMRFTIEWKDAATANDDFDPAPIVKELYPDQAKFRQEERRRFELLVEHMDVPVSIDDLSSWPK
jgi:hypothetical protein